MRKRSNNQGVNYKLKGYLKSFQKLKDLVSDREEFERELKEAIKILLAQKQKTGSNYL